MAVYLIYCYGNLSEMSDHSCYLRDSGLDIHENCCRGAERHPLTYVGRRRFWYGPLTMFQMGVKQIWYLVSVTYMAMYLIRGRASHT